MLNQDKSAEDFVGLYSAVLLGLPKKQGIPGEGVRVSPKPH